VRHITTNSGLSDFFKISLAVLVVAVGAWHLNQVLTKYGIFKIERITIPVRQAVTVAPGQEQPQTFPTTDWSSFIYGDSVFADVDLSKSNRLALNEQSWRDKLILCASYLLTTIAVVVVLQLLRVVYTGAIRRSRRSGARVLSNQERLMLKNPVLKAMLSPQPVSEKVGTPIAMTHDEQEKMLNDIGWYEFEKRNEQLVLRQSIKAS
jgi:hypothetical protein